MADTEKITSPIKAIRAFCLECSGDSAREVKECTARSCVLYPFRFGENPYRTKRELTDEQRAELRDRMKNARKKKRWCERQDLDENENKMYCTGHLAEGRLFICPYKDPQDRLDSKYPCSDYMEVGNSV